MDLKEALERLKWLEKAKPSDHGSWVRVQPPDVEALGVVLAAARENYSAKVVAETNRLSAQALEMARQEEARGMANATTVPHLFVGRSGAECYLCHKFRGHELHQRPESP